MRYQVWFIRSVGRCSCVEKWSADGKLQRRWYNSSKASLYRLIRHAEEGEIELRVHWL